MSQPPLQLDVAMSLVTVHYEDKRLCPHQSMAFRHQLSTVPCVLSTSSWNPSLEAISFNCT